MLSLLRNLLQHTPAGRGQVDRSASIKRILSRNVESHYTLILRIFASSLMHWHWGPLDRQIQGCASCFCSFSNQLRWGQRSEVTFVQLFRTVQWLFWCVEYLVDDRSTRLQTVALLSCTTTVSYCSNQCLFNTHIKAMALYPFFETEGMAAFWTKA